MYKSFLVTITCVAFGLTAGCNNAKSPEAVSNDVATAQHSADANVAEARKDAAKDNNSAMMKADDRSRDAANVEATGAYDVAVAKAEGNHKVDLQKCEALAGDAQKKCRSMADADYDAARANAKAAEAARKQ